MKSFDYFDTLVTRLVAKPADLFRLMEQMQGWSGFAARRMAAEYAARQVSRGAEVALADIYRHLQMPAHIKDAAEALELHLERSLAVPVQANIDRLGSNDIVVSDMYLPTEELRAGLARLCNRSPAAWVVSSSEGVRKADGKLWERVQSRHPDIDVHTGDNLVSDVMQARRFGIPAEHYTGSQLNRHERSLADGSIDGSIVAASCRAARLAVAQVDESEPVLQLDAIFASVFAPAFTAFVDWMCDCCVERGVRRILFLARDGQLLYRIAQERIRMRMLQLEPVYVYGSRRALHLPGFTRIEQATSWLLENTPVLTLGDVADRASLPRTFVAELGLAYGFTAVDVNIPESQRPRLIELVANPRFVHALLAESRKHWFAAHDYYASVGLHEGRVALVDVGWNGRMQASLRGILSKSPNPDVRVDGYYFSLTRKLRTSEFDTLEGYSHDPECDSGPNPWDGFRAMVEAALEADHGSTLRFELGPNGAQAVLGESPVGSALAAVQRQQTAVLGFVRALGQAEAAIGRPVTINGPRALGNLLSLLRRPRAEEAAAFSARERAEGQIESRTQSLVRQVPFGPALLKRSALGFWPEGSVAMSGHAWLVPVLAVARSIRRSVGA